jgi:DNA repair protein RecN (Recombination protein N)
MLSSLSIRDVVLIDRLDLDFSSGLCALTGETGAGKSIVLDSLGLALGGRAEARLIRHGADQASVSARFEVDLTHPTARLLDEHGVSVGDDGIQLRRLLARDGRSRAYINDQPVSTALLRRVGQLLVEIHGQFESQRLLDPASHRELLDTFGGLDPLSEACAAAWRDWRRAAAARRDAEDALAAARRDEEYLRVSVDELDTLEPRVGEETELAERRAYLQNAERLLGSLNAVVEDLTGGGRSGIEETLLGAIRQLQKIAERMPARLDPIITALERAMNEVTEAEDSLAKAIRDIDLDQASLEQVEERLFALRALARKHNVTVDALEALRDTMGQALAAVDDADLASERLAEAEREARARYHQAADALSAARATSAAAFDRAVAVELEPLRLGAARFITRIEPLDEASWGEHGKERVMFEVATNPGVPPGPLTRIASGGELARFMLALKVVLAKADPIPTLVFDEVDAGIGGAVAAAVGERLHRLAVDVQVLVVTHSPQVAARGRHHWRILKTMTDGEARTTVAVLGSEARREEIARMLAGARITDEARAAADSLLVGSAA